MSTAPIPFKLHVGDDVLADLEDPADARTLARRGARQPLEVRHRPALPEIAGGILARRYDWRKHEAQLNSFKQYKVRLAGIDLHFIREEGKGPKPMPLLILARLAGIGVRIPQDPSRC